MKKCERCGAKAEGEFGLLDYCAECSNDLCPKCMAIGCCGYSPAPSGQDQDESACAACDHWQDEHAENGMSDNAGRYGGACSVGGCPCKVFE